MRIVVTGATGNVGTSVVRRLLQEPRVDEVIGVSRRCPELELDRVLWHQAHVARDPLASVMRGADAVVHLAWLIQPSRRPDVLHETNVEGTRRVFEAAAAAGVPTLVHASSIGAYSVGPKDRAVDESFPTEGMVTSFYSRQKAAAERMLDALEARHPDMRVVRLRPGLLFKGESGPGIRRLFAGPFVPPWAIRPSAIPVVPDVPRLRFQAMHTDDVADAFVRAVMNPDARGAYNVAAEPVLDPVSLGRILGARPVPVPTRLLRAAVSASWRLRLQPTSPGWLDLALGCPIMDTTRIREELGWAPRHDAGEALLELMAGMRGGPGEATPPLDRDTGGPARVGEILDGVGERSM